MLTELVVPIDRTYTGTFLFRFATEFGNQEAEKALFYTAFSAFRWIAQRIDLGPYVSGGWPVPKFPPLISRIRRLLRCPAKAYRVEVEKTAC